MRLLNIPMILPDEEPTLAGRYDGRRALVRQLEQLPAINETTVVVLDFKNVELATSSFMGEAVVQFRDHLRLGRTPAYLVVANLNDRVAEELDDLLSRAADALLACSLSSDGLLSDARLLGVLEPKLKVTFELVTKKGEATATELHAAAAAADENAVGPTAWNNRLSALVAKSLLIEVPQGRAKTYTPIVESHSWA
ncbi:MAG: hypothetical protein RIC85_06210 [Gammaproteobacteria bacterium]